LKPFRTNRPEGEQRTKILKSGRKCSKVSASGRTGMGGGGVFHNDGTVRDQFLNSRVLRRLNDRKEIA